MFLLAPAHMGSLGQKAVTRLCVCVCVCVRACVRVLSKTIEPIGRYSSKRL